MSSAGKIENNTLGATPSAFRGPLIRMAGFAAAAIAGSGVASAQSPEQKWYLNAGPGVLTLEDGVELSVGGVTQPDFEITTVPSITAIAELGRYVYGDQLSIALTVGLPPTAEIEGAGFLVGQGRLADVTYGPSALTLKYHYPMLDGNVTPYVGAGVSYMMIFDTKDALLTDVEVDDDVGPVVQGGVEFRVNDKWGAFFDIKQAFLETTTTGSLGGAPVVAEVKMDPLVVTTGLSFRF